MPSKTESGCNVRVSYDSTMFLKISDGIEVNVPDSLDLVTPYVLQEQQDWFEDEIKFVRILLQAGDFVLDIGANYGIYALSMARIVGNQGRVWAFEPASSTADHLARSIERNGYHQVTLIRAALSDHDGTAQLSLHPNSEMNTLQTSADDQTETVELTTLDHAAERYAWRDIAFIKLDAEGEEGRILNGGARFLNKESPLIMYEMKHGAAVNTQLIEQFEQIGYRSYHLIPGLNLLAPFSLKDPLDAYQLNLFGCKDDRAAKLALSGKLAYPINSELTIPEPSNWQHHLGKFPYAKLLMADWETLLQRSPTPDWEGYRTALGLYFAAHSASSPVARYLALEKTYRILLDLCRQQANLPRLISLSRAAWEFGQRQTALDALAQALSAFRPGATVQLNEPFLATCRRFDLLDPAGRLVDWLFASLLEQVEKLQDFSSYPSGRKNLQRLQTLHATGFQSEEMDRRIKLIQERYALSS